MGLLELEKEFLLDDATATPATVATDQETPVARVASVAVADQESPEPAYRTKSANTDLGLRPIEKPIDIWGPIEGLKPEHFLPEDKSFLLGYAAHGQFNNFTFAALIEEYVARWKSAARGQGRYAANTWLRKGSHRFSRGPEN